MKGHVAAEYERLGSLAAPARSRVESRDVVILGAGLCGLAAATVLGDRAIIVERDQSAGGLARTERLGEYWFDRVLHLLHFADPDVERRIKAIVGDNLAPCPPDAWIECAAGVVRYPFQFHLGGLRAEVADACLRDFLRAGADDASVPAQDHAEVMLRTFGAAMCTEFYFPYNLKLWRRPLSDLAPGGFHWNLDRPSVDAVLAGVEHPDSVSDAYNANGWYPRPPAGSPVRGMEVLVRALAARAADLRLGQTVEAIDLSRHAVRVRRGSELVEVQFTDACLSTLPLPRAVALCVDADPGLKRACARLSYNRVRSVALALRGRRPVRPGMWRYYTDETLAFTRLVHPVEFDPLLAPADGWSLLAEVTERGEDRLEPAGALIERVVSDVSRIGVLAGCEIRDARVFDADPAYVVFTPDSAAIAGEARAYLAEHGVTSLGRYGAWEYSSMAQVMADGLAWADALGEDPGRSNGAASRCPIPRHP